MLFQKQTMKLMRAEQEPNQEADTQGDGHSGGDKKQSLCIFNVELVGFADVLDLEQIGI